MTLFRQINSLLFGLFLLVMCTLVYFQFTQTRDFMNNQMESDLNNTSTSLGLMLKPHLETGDLVGAETIVNVIFEGGSYRSVTLTWLSSDKTQTWNNPNVSSVPNWFEQLDLFKSQRKETIITSGWMQLAKLEIESDPSLGYRELWRIMNDTLLILSILFILSIFSLRFRLNYILKPLDDVARHARQIAEKKFTQDMALPKTKELQDVVLSINTMSRQLKEIFNSLDNEVSKLKTENLIDHASGLPNRQYFSAQVNSWLSEPGIGGLILAKMEWLDAIHSQYGYQVRDETIRVLGVRLQAELSKISETVIARVANTEFAFLVSKAEHGQIEKYVQCLIRVINQEMVKAGCEPNNQYALGVSERSQGIDLSNFLSQSDNALQQALKGNKVLQWYDTEKAQQFSREQWRTRLIKAINNSQFSFQWQAVMFNDRDDVMQREMFCRLLIDDKTVNASQFMPYIELLSLGSQLDQCLLTAMEKRSILAMNYESVAVNLTHDSLNDPNFHLWLEKFLRRVTFVERLNFEIPEVSANNSPSECQQLCRIIRDCGAKFGIDQCGRHMGSLDYLRKLRPHYIKLDQSFAYYDRSNSNNELCRALVNVAKGLDIEVIITAIEDDEQLSHFKALRTDGYQGYICPPTDIV